MFKVFYRTDAAFQRNPVAFSAPEEGVKNDDYEFVARFGDNVSLEDVFRQMNVVDGTELPTKLHVRSMSCGDIAIDELDGVWFCAASGWEKTTIIGGLS